MLNHLQQRPSSPTEPMQLVFGLIFVVFEHKRTLLKCVVVVIDRKIAAGERTSTGTGEPFLEYSCKRDTSPCIHPPRSVVARCCWQCVSAWHRLQDPRPRAVRGLRRVHRMALIGRLRARSTFICTKLWRLNWGSSGAIRAASNTST